MKAIVNTKLILMDRIIWDGVVLFEGGKILRAGPAGEVSVPENCERIDAGGLYTGPGFVDIHTHGGGGHWFHEEPVEAAAHFLSHGETFILPALYFSLTLEGYLEGIRCIRGAMEQGQGPARAIGGIYMEGPYLNPGYGADKLNNPWQGPPDPKQYMALLEAGRDLFKVHCVAPERDGVEDFVRAAAGPGVVFSVAHSEAYPDRIEPLFRYGLRLITHFNDATGAVVRYPEVRGVGPDEMALLQSDMYTELICDSRGVHVDPWMLRMVLKVKDRERIILISDSTEFNGPDPVTFEPAPDLRYDFDEQIAGTCLTMDAACRNMMQHTGAGLCDVFRFAALNPATLLGMQYEIGSIREGARANLVVVDDTVTVKRVFLEGEEIHPALTPL
ncbi:MAG: amidohydrolase family protein [Treponema sp.]|jgi:N-acetylglucosamine-6-phosphate deacetylase|nr:amidohydrolase family protein [Treponema sp.]